ncbi:MAG: hypothetical protein R3D89_05820 [Sphingomonadaceae bacterium]
MDDPATAPAPDAAAEAHEKQHDSFTVFLLKLLLVVVIFRSFFFSPFNILADPCCRAC